MGDMIYFHSFRSPGFILDIVGDIRALNELARKSKKAGMIILGGGVCKHQIANAMLIVTLLRPPYLVQLMPTPSPFSAMVLTIQCSSYACGS
jgi:deoxyhypusine synthase